jgi:hypothetical protein
MEQVASVGQVTELSSPGAHGPKAACMAVQSARPGHVHQVIMEPGSREGPGTRYAGSVDQALTTNKVR